MSLKNWIDLHLRRAISRHGPYKVYLVMDSVTMTGFAAQVGEACEDARVLTYRGVAVREAKHFHHPTVQVVRMHVCDADVILYSTLTEVFED